MDEFEPPTDRPPEREGRGWITAVAIIAVLAIGGAIVWNFRDRLFGGSSSATDAYEPQPVELDAGVLEQKSLAEGDEKIRTIGAGGSKSAALAGWLSSPNIIQRIAAATKLIADGKSPAPVISFIEIGERFAVIEKATTITIDPKSYTRYDAVVDAFTSIDATYAARAYADLRPYFDTAYAEVAEPGERFDSVLREALVRLTSVKVPDDPIELTERGAIYVFKDPALENLTPAEKHVIRLGKKNADAFQNSLRKFAEAAKIQL